MMVPWDHWTRQRTGAVWYRLDIVRYAGPVDEWGDVSGPGRTDIRKYEYPVIKNTPKGVWLAVYGDAKFVLRDARKRYACPTIEEALKSFIARKKKQIAILSSRIEEARDGIQLAEYKYGDPEKRKEKGLEWLGQLR